MKILRDVTFTAKWWLTEYGIECKNPMEESLEEQIETKIRKSRLLYRRYGHLGIGEPDPKPPYDVPQYDGRIVIAGAYGGKRPSWAKDTACYWLDKSASALGHITSAREIAKIKIPNWDNNPLLNETFERYEKDKASSYFKEGRVNYPWTLSRYNDPRTKLTHQAAGYICAVDLAPFLFGDTAFFSVMAEDDDFTFAFLDKCYEIATDHTAYMAKRFGLDIGKMGWESIGGDYSCLLSPGLYEKFIKPYDLRRMEENNLHFINLHSCGASAHLYGVWGKYPNRESILLMQTRGIEGRLAHLRQCLPHTLIQLTLHQPQCDFENITAGEVERIVRSYAEEARYDNLELVVLVVQSGENTDANIEALCKAVDQIT